MTGQQIRQKYLEFFQKKDHHIVPSAPIVPQNDPTTLFTGSGMQPMINYFLGEKHPLGKRIVDSQKCFRAEDIEEVGDNRHTTFFEMLGNWSFGDYWKREQLSWIFEFLTDVVGLDPGKLYVTVFSGDPENNIPQDDEAVEIWQDLFKKKGIDAKPVKIVTQKEGERKGIQNGRIFYYEASKNWWSRSGIPDNMPAGEPGGPDSEIFYEFTGVEHNKQYGEHCHPNCDCGRFLEIGNSVFMAYVKEEDGTFSELPDKNIDFGGGLERISAAAGNNPDIFITDLFRPLIDHIREKSGQDYAGRYLYPIRLIADHLRSATMMMAEGIEPGNKAQGYIIRRLLRRSIMQADTMGIQDDFLAQLIPFVANYFKDTYPEVHEHQDTIQQWVSAEESKFRKTLSSGRRHVNKVLNNKLTDNESPSEDIIADITFNSLATHGLPFEITTEIITQSGVNYDLQQVSQIHQELIKEHQEKSRSNTGGTFKGGLADHSEVIVKYHTATHLLHQALRDVLGDHAKQMGSNITQKRLRFDFKHPKKLTSQEIQKIEDTINQKITANLPVQKTTEDKDQALASGALAFFRENYPSKVTVYTIGKDPKKDWYSKELCGGPHVSSTAKIGPVTIKKEQAVAAGIRRIYMVFKN